MSSNDDERQARDQILAAVTTDPDLAAEMFRSMDDIEELAVSKGMSVRGARVVYVRWLRKIIGPSDPMPAELLDRALDVLEASDALDDGQQALLAQCLKAEAKRSCKGFERMQQIVNARVASRRGIPEWLAEIVAQPRPNPPGRGRPRGAGRVRSESAQESIATLAYVLAGLLKRQDPDYPLESETHPAESVYGIVADALKEEGIGLEWYSVRDAYKEYAKAWPSYGEPT